MSGHSALQNQMRLQAAMARGAFADAAIGVVSSLDIENYCAKVRLQPQNVETGWLPIASMWVGGGWGMFAPIPVGTQVTVVFAEASLDSGIITGALFHDRMRPLGCPEGEFWLVHEGGAHLKFFNDGNVEIKAPLTTIDGELKVTGDITDNTPGNGVTLKALRDAYNAHKHTGVQSGGAQSGTTTNPAT